METCICSVGECIVVWQPKTRLAHATGLIQQRLNWRKQVGRLAGSHELRANLEKPNYSTHKSCRCGILDKLSTRSKLNSYPSLKHQHKFEEYRLTVENPKQTDPQQTQTEWLQNSHERPNLRNQRGENIEETGMQLLIPNSRKYILHI